MVDFLVLESTRTEEGCVVLLLYHSPDAYFFQEEQASV